MHTPEQWQLPQGWQTLIPAFTTVADCIFNSFGLRVTPATPTPRARSHGDTLARLCFPCNQHSARSCSRDPSVRNAAMSESHPTAPSYVIHILTGCCFFIVSALYIRVMWRVHQVLPPASCNFSQSADAAHAVCVLFCSRYENEHFCDAAWAVGAQLMTSSYRYLDLRAKPKRASSFQCRLTILHPALSLTQASEMMRPQAFAVPRKLSRRLLATCLFACDHPRPQLHRCRVAVELGASLYFVQHVPPRNPASGLSIELNIRAFQDHSRDRIRHQCAGYLPAQIELPGVLRFSSPRICTHRYNGARMLDTAC